MIEKYQPYIERLLLNEPWRAGEGDIKSPCSGALAYDGTRFWLCACERIGVTPTVAHFPVKVPVTVSLFRKVARFMKQPVTVP